MGAVKDAHIVLQPVLMGEVLWEVRDYFSYRHQAGSIANSLISVQVTLFVRNSPFPTSHLILSILETFLLMLLLEMSPISSQVVNAQTSESSRTNWK